MGYLSNMEGITNNGAVKVGCDISGDLPNGMCIVEEQIPSDVHNKKPLSLEEAVKLINSIGK